MRLFVAVDLSEEARQAMAAAQKRIAGALAGRPTSLKWVKPEHMHLTLVFLGSVDEERARAVVDAMGRDVDAAPFDMVFDGVDAFPPHGEPRVLWAGVTQGAAELVALHRELGQRAAALGIRLEDRSFHPHLTLGRWRESRRQDRERARAAEGRDPIARVRVRRATLYESRLSPSGPAHTALAHATLTR
jgi:RNA 2',3'-cyclic 3'-phosphodiesterase